MANAKVEANTQGKIRIYAINGGPRKTWNTATMLEHFLKGAASTGEDVQTEMIHLFDLKYTGCRSCFLCKLNGPTYGKCGCRDGLLPILEMLSTQILKPIVYRAKKSCQQPTT